MSSERFRKERKKNRGVGEETELGDTHKIFYRKKLEKYLIWLKKTGGGEDDRGKNEINERKEN